MFLCRIVLLSVGIFVLVEGKSYGKNWYPKKYSHSVHKRVDPNYWDDLTLENHLLPIQPLSGKKFKNNNGESDIFHSKPWLHRKKYLSFTDTYFPSQMILKRYKRNDGPNSKNGEGKQKKFYNKLQKDKRQSNYLNQYDKNKLLKKLYSLPDCKALKI